ncbi:hypothetical protein FA13DRAFT_1636414, partial [Coprinellus micaceus]
LKVETTFTPASCNRKSRKSKAGDRLKVNYVGFLFSLLPRYLSSTPTSSPASPTSSTSGFGQVIAGWDRGLTKMCVGEKRVLTIPASQTNREYILSFIQIRFVSPKSCSFCRILSCVLFR